MNTDPIRELPLGCEMTQAEVAKALGITRQTVAKLERSALEKVRRRLEVCKWLDCDSFNVNPKGVN